MANNISNILNSRVRLTGMSSGLDTEGMIKKLMDVERYKVDKVKQDKQLLEWKRNDYRSMTKLLTEFKNTYMDVLSPTDMRSSSSYQAFTVSSTNTTDFSVTANADAVAGTHQIAVNTLAKAAFVSSGSGVSATLQSTAPIADFNFTGGKDFNIQLNGVTKNIKLTQDFTGATALADLRSELELQVNSAFGAGKVNIGISGGGLTFSAADSKVTLTSGTTDALAQLKIASASTNRLNLSSKLDVINMTTAPTGLVEFNINGVNFSFDSTTKTMRDVINTVNSSAAGVTLNYSEATDKFTLTSKVKGAGDAIKIQEVSGGLFGATSKLGIIASTVSNGQDSEFVLDGVTIKRNDNTFAIDGVIYNLLKEGVSSTVTVGQDVDKIYGNIKNFVDKYNELITKITTQLTAKREKEYPPLTEEQRSSMSESDIKSWEDKAKSGLIRNDNLLSSILTEMRSAMYKTIDGVDGGIYSIGIKTGDYLQQGKLIIDEAKLKDTIINKPDLVANIFNKESTIDYSPNLDEADRTTRMNESGIVHRLFDIIQSNINVIPNNEGAKGALIEKAGFITDNFDVSSLISSQILNKMQLIDTLTDKLMAKEDQYYKKFAAMEKAMSRMNSQSSWLSQQFGGGQ